MTSSHHYGTKAVALTKPTNVSAQKGQRTHSRSPTQLKPHHPPHQTRPLEPDSQEECSACFACFPSDPPLLPGKVSLRARKGAQLSPRRIECTAHLQQMQHR
ncbi:hypothetical protein N431DRAFT_436477 [Stipitochalara longipes BDJ]|nr:hypothetical protein N431DRAFT_436477 [Stipitochalara longipes BDJ]